MRYQKEKAFLQSKQKDIENIFKKVDKERINKVVLKYPNVPIDYIDFLKEIGAGYFNNAQYEIKDYLFNLSDIWLEETYDIADTIAFFGDNYSGDFAGFDLSKDKPTVIELEHSTGEIIETNLTFAEFIRQQIGIS